MLVLNATQAVAGASTQAGAAPSLVDDHHGSGTRGGLQRLPSPAGPAAQHHRQHPHDSVATCIVQVPIGASLQQCSVLHIRLMHEEQMMSA
jgi:hypothetical protein